MLDWEELEFFLGLFVSILLDLGVFRCSFFEEVIRDFVKDGNLFIFLSNILFLLCGFFEG